MPWRSRNCQMMIGRRFSFACLVVLVLTPQSFAGSRSGQILIASDLHFNPFADPTLVAALTAAPPNLWEPILNRTKPTAYSPYGEDTNWWLLQSALDAMRTTKPHPALIMITGDLLAHGFPQAYARTTNDSDREHYRAFVLKTVEFLAWEVRKRFKKEQILLTPGNNDDDCGDYQIDAGGPFLSDTAALGQSLARAGSPFAADWKALGSYAVQPRGIHGVRILSVNSVFFSNKYQAANFASGCSAKDSTAATQTFTWLETNLVQARQAKQKVWLMFHIPPGIDGFSTMVQYWRSAAARAPAGENLCSHAIVPMWKPVWTARFEEILSEYQNTITASFAGHDHTDDFRVIHAGEEGGEFVLIDPPISPIYGQNPAFRVVSFGEGGELRDQSTYYLTNLTAARSEAPGTWMREYTFSQEWQSQQLDARSLKSVYDRIQKDPNARDQYLKLLNVSSSRISVPAIGVEAISCAVAALDPAAYLSCYCPAPGP
jgi:sphingomyelin phosphodiesterase acid-like 3